MAEDGSRINPERAPQVEGGSEVGESPQPASYEAAGDVLEQAGDHSCGIPSAPPAQLKVGEVEHWYGTVDDAVSATDWAQGFSARVIKMSLEELVETIDGQGGMLADLQKAQTFLASDDASAEKYADHTKRWGQLFVLHDRLLAAAGVLGGALQKRDDDLGLGWRFLRLLGRLVPIEFAYKREEAATQKLLDGLKKAQRAGFFKKIGDVPDQIRKARGKRFQENFATLNKFVREQGVEVSGAPETAFDVHNFGGNKRMGDLYFSAWTGLQDLIGDGASGDQVERFMAMAQGELRAAHDDELSPHGIPEDTYGAKFRMIELSGSAKEIEKASKRVSDSAAAAAAAAAAAKETAEQESTATITRVARGRVGRREAAAAAAAAAARNAEILRTAPMRAREMAASLEHAARVTAERDALSKEAYLANSRAGAAEARERRATKAAAEFQAQDDALKSELERVRGAIEGVEVEGPDAAPAMRGGGDGSLAGGGAGSSLAVKATEMREDRAARVVQTAMMRRELAEQAREMEAKLAAVEKEKEDFIELSLQKSRKFAAREKAKTKASAEIARNAHRRAGEADAGAARMATELEGLKEKMSALRASTEELIAKAHSEKDEAIVAVQARAAREIAAAQGKAAESAKAARAAVEEARQSKDKERAAIDAQKASAEEMEDLRRQLKDALEAKANAESERDKAVAGAALAEASRAERERRIAELEQTLVVSRKEEAGRRDALEVSKTALAAVRAELAKKQTSDSGKSAKLSEKLRAANQLAEESERKAAAAERELEEARATMEAQIRLEFTRITADEVAREKARIEAGYAKPLKEADTKLHRVQVDLERKLLDSEQERRRLESAASRNSRQGGVSAAAHREFERQKALVAHRERAAIQSMEEYGARLADLLARVRAETQSYEGTDGPLGTAAEMIQNSQRSLHNIIERQKGKLAIPLTEVPPMVDGGAGGSGEELAGAVEELDRDDFRGFPELLSEEEKESDALAAAAKPAAAGTHSALAEEIAAAVSADLAGATEPTGSQRFPKD